MRRAATALLTLALIAGCGTHAPTLRETCDALAPVVHDFGKIAPTPSRFDAYAPRVRAIIDQGDDEAQTALEPYAAAFESGSVWQLAGVSIGTQSLCKAAGSTGWN